MVPDVQKEFKDFIFKVSSSSSSGPGAYALDAPQPIRLIVQP